MASSTPATSLKVIFFCCVVSRRARLLPNDRALLPPVCICRIMKIQKPIKSKKGAALSSILTQELLELSLTVITTPFSRRMEIKSG